MCRHFSEALASALFGLVFYVGLDVSYALLHQNLVHGNKDARLFDIAELGVDGRAEHAHGGTEAHVGVHQRRDVISQAAHLGIEKGLDKNTPVIFSSDNGPHEEGGADPAFFGRDGKLRGLKRQCYEGGIRVPFIAWWPGRIQGGQVNDHQLAFYDVMPTFCELVGDKKFPKKYLNKKLEGDCFDGISFAPTLLGQDERQAKHDFLYWEFHETDQIGLRMGDWKLVVVRGVPRLYDLATDIHEDHDVAAQHPDIVRQMTDIILREHRPSELFRVTLPTPAEP